MGKFKDWVSEEWPHVSDQEMDKLKKEAKPIKDKWAKVKRDNDKLARSHGFKDYKQMSALHRESDEGPHSVEFYDARERQRKADWHYRNAGKRKDASLGKGIKQDYEAELLRRGVKDSNGRQKPLHSRLFMGPSFQHFLKKESLDENFVELRATDKHDPHAKPMVFRQNGETHITPWEVNKGLKSLSDHVKKSGRTHRVSITNHKTDQHVGFDLKMMHNEVPKYEHWFD